MPGNNYLLEYQRYLNNIAILRQKAFHEVLVLL